jgi:hypothetical protein
VSTDKRKTGLLFEKKKQKTFACLASAFPEKLGLVTTCTAPPRETLRQDYCMSGPEIAWARLWLTGRSNIAWNRSLAPRRGLRAGPD